MKIYGKCNSCKRNKFFVRKRVYMTKHVGEITSQEVLCGKCFSNISKML